MAIPASGPVSLTTIQTEFGGSNPISLSEYYAGGSFVSAGTTGTYGAVPTSGAIGIRNFYGTAKTTIGDTWVSLSSLNSAIASPNTINCLARSPTTFVASGQNASCAVSSAGVTWVSTTSGLQAALGISGAIDHLIWGNSQFVGAQVALVTSPDGITWTRQTGFDGRLNSGSVVTAIFWDGSKYIVLGIQGEIVTSSDAVTWTRVGTISTFVFDAAYNGTTFVAVGSNSLCATSTNGTTWTTNSGLNSAVSSSSFRTISYYGGTFIALADDSKCATSTNGTTWTSRAGYGAALGSTEGAWRSYAYGTGVIASTFTNKKVVTTTDGITWTLNTTLPAAVGAGNRMNAFVYGTPSGVPKLIAAGDGPASAISPTA